MSNTATSEGLNYLLIEDDDAHAKIVMRTFEKENLRGCIYRVRDGVEALRYLRQEGEYDASPKPDVVLLDLKLPKVSGFDVLREIRLDRRLECLPVVVLTTSEAEVDKEKACRLRANSYLVKPAEAESFRAMLRDLNTYWGLWNRPVTDTTGRARRATL